LKPANSVFNAEHLCDANGGASPNKYEIVAQALSNHKVVS